jgi:hypothetical protein
MTIKITNLPNIETIDSSDVLPIVDVSEDVTRNISIEQIADTMPPITINGQSVSLGGSVTIAVSGERSGGAVTSISTNNGITGGTITDTGTIGLTGTTLSLHELSTDGIVSKTGTTLSTVSDTITINGQSVSLGGSVTIPVGEGSGGTVTSISTNNGITGGTITDTGTIGLTGQALSFHNLSTNGVVTKNGSTISSVAPGSTGNVLTSDGTTWISSPAPTGGDTSNFVTLNTAQIIEAPKSIITSSTDPVLKLEQKGSSLALLVFNEKNNISTVIDNVGRVGIHNSTPTKQLDVRGSVIMSGSSGSTTEIISNTVSIDGLETSNSIINIASQFIDDKITKTINIGNNGTKNSTTSLNIITTSQTFGSVKIGATDNDTSVEINGQITHATSIRNLSITEATGNITLNSSHNYIFCFETSTVTLPRITTSNVGIEYSFRKFKAGQLVITPNSSDSIDNGSIGDSMNLTTTSLSIWLRLRATEFVVDGVTRGIWMPVYFTTTTSDLMTAGGFGFAT